MKEQIEKLKVPPVALVASLTFTDQHYKAIADLMAPQGKFGLIDDPPEFTMSAFKGKAISVHWELMFTRSSFQTPDMIAQHHLLNDVADLIDKGVLRTTLDQTFGTINAANLKRAHALLESGKQVADGIVRRALFGGLLRCGAGRRRVSVLESRPGEIGPGIAEVGGLLDRLIQHLLRIARPLGDQEQAAIIGLERLHRIRLLERDPEQFVGGIQITEASLGNHRKAMIDAALFRRNEKRLIEPERGFAHLAGLYRYPGALGCFLESLFARPGGRRSMALTNLSSSAFCSELLAANPKNGCSLTGAA